jgi:hypothetical protein
MTTTIIIFLLVSSLVFVSSISIASVYAVNTMKISVMIKKGTFFGNNYYVQNDKINFTFGSTNPLCPNNNCNYKFQDGQFADSLLGGENTKVFKGVLKIENKPEKAEQNITSYKNYQMSGAMKLVASKENKVTGEPVIDTYKGDLGFDTEDAIFFPKYVYQSIATYDHRTQIFHLQGRAK